MLVSIAQKKDFDALNTKQKKPSSDQSTISEKNQEKPLKMVLNGKNG